MVQEKMNNYTNQLYILIKNWISRNKTKYVPMSSIEEFKDNEMAWYIAGAHPDAQTIIRYVFDNEIDWSLLYNTLKQEEIFFE